MQIGIVALTVRNLDAVGRFYREVIGLAVIDEAPALLRLGVDGRVLLELRHDSRAEIAGRGEAGLFHTAFLLPTRADLAHWLRRARALGVTMQGASDHLVSEAFYLADPEGNGIEVYRDRPSDTWSWSDGMIAMATEPLDLPGLRAHDDGRAWTGLPAGSLIGHVHLQVGDLTLAEAFYSDVLGLPVTCRYPGGTFYGAGGYHHHLGTNVWNSRGAGARRAGTAGLASVELVADTREILAGMGGQDRQACDGVLTLQDPWGTIVLVRAP